MSEEFYANDTSPDSDDAPSSLITWTFNLEYADGERRLRECLDAPNVKTALREFDEELRRRWKYGEDGAQMMTVEQVRGLLWTTLNRYEVSLDE